MRLARQLLLALWAGVLIAVGALLAPTVFRVLADRAQAGAVAAELFHRTTLVSVACALLLIALGAAERNARRARVLAPLGAACVLLANEYIVRPLMQAARAGDKVDAFIAWHVVATVCYALATAGVLALLVAELRRRD